MKRNKKAAADPFEAVDVTQAFAGPIYQRSDGRRNVEELVIKQPISPTMVRVVSSQSQLRAEIAILWKVVVVSFCDGANPGRTPIRQDLDGVLIRRCFLLREEVQARHAIANLRIES